MSKQRRPGDGGPRRPKRKKRKKSRRWLLYLFLIFFGIFLGAAGVAANFVYEAYQTLPTFEEFEPSLTSVILDRDGEVVYRLAADENRTLIKDLDEIPREVQLAFIATEDKRFYEHFGVDLYRLAGAILNDFKYFMGMEGSQLEGGSTITMQLARNAFLTLDQTLTRKVQEMMIAIQLERRFTKDEILLKYLNQVSFGGQAYGLEAAAQTYFAKHAKDLTLSEAAMLAGMLKAPSTYNPFTNYEGAMERRAIVLDLMVENGYLTPERAEQLKKERPEVRSAEITPVSISFTGDWYVDHVIEILTDPTLAEKYGTPLFDERDLYTKGLKIHTALDRDIQKIVEETVPPLMLEQTLYYGGSEDEVPEAAVVIKNHRTGEVLAIYGGLEHKTMRAFNRATQAYRQPGSAIKPLVAYLPAIDLLGYGPGTVIDDSPVMLNQEGDDVWPKNYEPFYYGLIPMRFGLEQSLNTIAVRLMQAVTPIKGIEYGRKLGLTTLITPDQDPVRNDQNLALALGGLTKGVTVMDMATAYGTLGSLGIRTDSVVITKIENQYGEVIYQATPRKVPVIKNKDSVWLMVDIMKGNFLRGTPSYWSKQWHGWPAGGKTGTTEDWHDAWFVGFTTELVTAVWTGYDNDEGRKVLPGRPGLRWTGAGPPTVIWTAIMDQLYKEPPPDWERPKNVVAVQICKTSGLLPSPLCPPDQIYTEWFRKGYEPKKVDDVWKLVKVVKQPWQIPGSEKTIDRWLLWKPGCGEPVEKLMIDRPYEYAKHPEDPWNFDRYWPRDWQLEIPEEECTPVEPPPDEEDNPNQPPGDGDTQPPGTNPPEDGGDPGINPPDDGNDPGTPPPGDGGGDGGGEDDNGLLPPNQPPVLPPGDNDGN